MNGYILLFGRTPKLSVAEVNALIPDVRQVSDVCVHIPVPEVKIDGRMLPVKDLLGILGGTVKIASELQEVDEVSPEMVSKMIAESNGPTKIAFGISIYGGGVGSPEAFNASVKNLLEIGGRKCRYFSDPSGIISSSTVGMSGMTEIVIVRKENGFIVGRTVAVQAFDAWSKRDYGRPERDTKVGMLPPKVARIAVNIALGPDASGKVLLDPFCGMGTVLMEAMHRGVEVVGSDLDAVVVAKARENLHWAMGSMGYATPLKIEKCDATHVDELLGEETVDAIVTEPYMGPIGLGLGNMTDHTKLTNIMKGLQKMYTGFVKSAYSVLKIGGTAVIAVPRYSIGKRVYDVKNIVDMCETLGYTKVLGPVEYSREHAVVSREFYVFLKGTR